jgi:hypothetical protein
MRTAPGISLGTDSDQKSWLWWQWRRGTAKEEFAMDTTTLLIIVLVILLVSGGGWYGRGRWY